MEGEATFFSDQLLVVASLAPRGHPHLEGPGGGHGHGGRGGHGHRHHQDEDSPPPASEEDGEPQAHLRDSPFPILSLRLHLTNQTGAPVDVALLECSSSLGNFVVHPEKATLDSHGVLDTEPMNSRLGISGEAIPVTVSLKHAGKVEKKIITLKAKVPPPN
jgi:hypothetical protein